MNKTNLLKVFFILILSVMVILITTSVNAAELNDISNQLISGNTSGSGSTNNAGTNTQTPTNTNRLNTSNTNGNRTNNASRNSSIYNNTNLPKTGIGDSLPIAALVVVFGISAVYAYKKIKDYRNI